MTQQTQITVRHLSHLTQPVEMTVAAEKYLFIIYNYVCMATMSEFQKDCQIINILKTERIVSVKISSHDPIILNSIFFRKQSGF